LNTLPTFGDRVADRSDGSGFAPFDELAELLLGHRWLQWLFDFTPVTAPKVPGFTECVGVESWRKNETRGIETSFLPPWG
jgi:hypothetical protein